jgi:anti-sigma regulatory factor (Ser/Thr protein kinase)
VVVPHQPQGARIARHRLAVALAGQVSRGQLADAEAIAAELVGNAIRHAAPLPGGLVRVDWRLRADGGLQIRVTDGGSDTAPVLRPPSTCSLDGRGLAIVAALSSDWGFQPDGGGTCVWARLS